MRRASLFSAALIASFSSPALAADHRFALSMMHFNVQYVAGGLIGSKLAADPANAPDDRDVEDGIVTQSFEPVLDLYLAHPTWGGDVEMQGYMLDVIAARHPGVLEKLRTLAVSGQLEVVSFHYSDQLFVGHAKEDWERSVTLNQATFAARGIPLGKAVFCQEGQSSEGMAAAMTAHGYRTLVWPKNLFSYQHEGLAPKPLYQFGEATMLTSNGLSYTQAGETLDLTWTFVDDGELLATGGINPYIWDVHDGLIGLGGGRWIVKDQAFVHVGARVRVDGPNVQFHEDTMSEDDAITWVFHVLDADEAAAVAFAGSLNVRPRAVR